MFWQLGRDNIGCMLLFLAWCRRTLNFLIVCAVSESWLWWSSFFAQAPAQSISQRTATTFLYIVLYFHFLYISHINQLHLHDRHLLPVMYISYMIYIILHSRCYTGVRAPKLLHRSSYIKEPFGKGLDGLPGGLTGASEGLEGGLRGLRRLQGGFKGAWEGLQGGLRRASGGLEDGLLEGGLKGASRGLQRGFKGASRELQGGFKGAWEGLQGGFKGASRGLEKGFKGASPFEAFKGLKGVSRGLEKGFKGAWEGLQGGLRRASRELDKRGLKGAWEGLEGLQGAWEGLEAGLQGEEGFKGAWEGLQGGFKRGWLGSAPPTLEFETLFHPIILLFCCNFPYPWGLEACPEAVPLRQLRPILGRQHSHQLLLSLGNLSSTQQIFSVQRLHGFRQVVTHVQSQQKDEL